MRLRLYDVTGRRVRELVSGMQLAGKHSVAWDLRDEAGLRVGVGLYLARLEVEGRALTEKIATLK